MFIGGKQVQRIFIAGHEIGKLFKSGFMIFEKTHAPQYALRLIDNGYGQLPFGLNLPANTFSKVIVDMKIDSFDQVQTDGLVMPVYASSGTNQRFYWGVNYALRLYLSWQATSWAYSSTADRYTLGIRHSIMNEIQSNGISTIYLDDNEVVGVTPASWPFNIASNIRIGYKDSVVNAKDMTIYSVRFIDASGNDYAYYDFQDGNGNIVTDKSGNNRHMTLSGSYLWVET